MKKYIQTIAAFAIIFLIASCSNEDANKTVLSIGHFPNITHAQALVAHNMSRKGDGWFEKRLGKDVKVRWQIFNAGPSAMQSIFADAVDITYVGPNPALNAYAKTQGKDIKIVSGATDGGAALVVNPNLNIKTPLDFKGKRIGTPQLGNTQDVACRAWLINNGIDVTLTGGDASVIATSNPEQLPLFKTGKLDAVWTVEPWVSRLVMEANGKIFLNQDDAIIAVVATSNKTIKNKPELLKKFIAAHKELTEWINKNPQEAQKIVQEELENLTHGKVSMDLVKAAWPHMKFTSKINKNSLQKSVDEAHQCGFLKDKLDISNIYYDNN